MGTILKNNGPLARGSAHDSRKKRTDPEGSVLVNLSIMPRKQRPLPQERALLDLREVAEGKKSALVGLVSAGVLDPIIRAARRLDEGARVLLDPQHPIGGQAVGEPTLAALLGNLLDPPLALGAGEVLGDDVGVVLGVAAERVVDGSARDLGQHRVRVNALAVGASVEAAESDADRVRHRHRLGAARAAVGSGTAGRTPRARRSRRSRAHDAVERREVGRAEFAIEAERAREGLVDFRDLRVDGRHAGRRLAHSGLGLTDEVLTSFEERGLLSVDRAGSRRDEVRNGRAVALVLSLCHCFLLG